MYDKLTRDDFQEPILEVIGGIRIRFRFRGKTGA